LLSDPRSAAFAREFAGQWLRLGDIAAQVDPDSERFAAMSPRLVAAMQAEPLAFLTVVFRENHPLTDVLDADWTMLDATLAAHYGIEGVHGEHMRRVDLPPESPRGGIIAMAGPLARYSTPLRSSPVERGVWIVEAWLGEHLPPPPPNVPQLSDGERNRAGETISEQLAAHRADPACASCHDRFDPLGIALEHFDAVGRWRDTDRAGDPIAAAGVLPATGERVAGVAGLRAYLSARRERFLRHFCNQLLGYGLGRVRQPSDQALIDAMFTALQAEGTRPRAAILELVTSPQFRTRRDGTGGEE